MEMMQQDKIIKIKIALLLLFLLIVTAVLIFQSLKWQFIGDDLLYRINIDRSVGWDGVEKEFIAKYNRGDINFDLKNHIISMHVGPLTRIVNHSWFLFVRWLLNLKDDASLYRLVIILQYLLASFFAYIFFRDMFGHVYPALMAAAVFHFSVSRESNLYSISSGFNSGFPQLLFCMGIMVFKKFLLLYSKPEFAADTAQRIRLAFLYMFTILIMASGTFSYDSYGPSFLGSILLLLIFEDAIYCQKSLLPLKKMMRVAIILLPFFVILLSYLLYRQQMKAEFLFKYKHLADIMVLDRLDITLLQFIAGYIYGILYYIPIHAHILYKMLLLHFEIIIPLIFTGLLFLTIWLLIKWKNKTIFNERKELYLFTLLILLVLLNIFPIVLNLSPHTALGHPLFFAAFLTILMRNIRFGNLFLAIYIAFSIFSFLQISSNYNKMDIMQKNALSEIGKKIENHQNYVSFANIMFIEGYPFLGLEADGFEKAILDSQGKTVHTWVPFFYYFYSFEDFKKGRITVEPLREDTNNSTFLVRLEDCICGIWITNLKQGADELEYSFGRFKVIEWQPKLNKYQKVTFAKTILFELKPGFKPLIIPMERLKAGI